MAGQVTIERRDSGELVARKAPIDSDDVAQLRREALVLERVQGDGVVELLTVLDEPDGDTATTGDSSRRPALELGYLSASLETAGPLDATTAVRLMAQTAAALARTHAIGISHGRVVASHVLRDARGGAVLCSWGGAGARPDLAELSPGPAFDPAGDVAQVGSLLNDLLEPACATNTSARGRARARSEQRLRTKAGALAAAARHPNPDLRPSMADLAQRLVDMVPAPAEPAGQGQRETAEAPSPGLASLAAIGRLFSSTAGHRWRASHLVVVAGVAALAAVVTVAGMAPFGDAGPSSAAAGPTGTAGTATTAPASPATTASTDPTAVVTAPGPACPTTADELATGGLPTTCREALAVSGREIRLGDARFVLGEDGDEVMLADLRCDGLDRPMLLRPGSGEVFTFDAWASSTADADGRLLGYVPGAVRLEAGPAGACGELIVVTGDGARTILHGEELR